MIVSTCLEFYIPAQLALLMYPNICIYMSYVRWRPTQADITTRYQAPCRAQSILDVSSIRVYCSTMVVFARGIAPP